MPTDLAHHIAETPLVDTHNHLQRESSWVDKGPDILQDLFGNYVPADLHSARVSSEAMQRLFNAEDDDIAGRFRGIRAAWEAVQFTGYGAAVRLIAERVYGLDKMTPKRIAKAASLARKMQKPGERYRMLRDDANLDHIQVDDFSWACAPDESGPDFFLYDISWAGLSFGEVNAKQIHDHTGIDVVDIASLRAAIEAIFAKYAPFAIAVKAQHAYNRTLEWTERSDAEAGAALDAVLQNPPETIGVHTRLCLGDWCWARGVELAAEHSLPFKLHTGYYAGNDRMPVSRIAPGLLGGMLAKYPNTRFVLMHASYPYTQELVALTKHYRNVWADLCWAWTIDPFSSRDFLRRFIHAAPINKVFAFGGDTAWPTSTLAYAAQARQEIDRALQAEVDEGYLTEKQAKAIATRIMRGNQHDCFDVEGTRANIRKALETGAAG